MNPSPQDSGCSRRAFLRRGAILGSAALVGPGVFLRPLRAAVGGGARNLILVELYGGNDGLNTVVPYGVQGGIYYTKYRPTVGIPEAALLKLPGGKVGFHPALQAWKALFDAGRLAVVQGVSCPDPSFSHEGARRIWHSGDPSGNAGDGWLGRYLAGYPAPAFPCAAEMFDTTTQLCAGAPGVVPAFPSLAGFTFPTDPLHPEDAALRRAAFQQIAWLQKHAVGGAGAIAATSLQVLDLIDAFGNLPAVSHVPYPPSGFSQALKVIVKLLVGAVGVRFVHVGVGGFDTHDHQNKNGLHAGLLERVASGLAAFQGDLDAHGLAQDTLVVVFSEFGRTVQENASGGTDHGSVGPVFVQGEAVAGGLVTEHPSLDPGALTPMGEPAMQADLRDVIGTVLMRWLGESPAAAQAILHGHAPADLGFLKG